MTRLQTCLLLLALAVTSCTTQQQFAPEKTVVAAAPTEAGEIRLPADSPQLKRLRIEEVRNEKVPVEEVVVPGKIEASPTRISRIALPVAGRVKQVMVTIG